jgi:hypothetical protein
MRKLGIILTLEAILCFILSITYGIIGSYRYEKEVSSYWDLADKASTITKKAEYLDKFVASLDNDDFKGKYNALVFTTPNNSFDDNFTALKTLQQRLHQIEGMDPTSFEYQTAIQQITGQEQGEAYEMLSVFKGVWWKSNYLLLWDWVLATQIVLSIIAFFVGLGLMIQYD